ncbi:MAG: hypothetical protein K8J08_14045 [Thermoanaerobaculia bacterium]|nr:hypothetical protein [Thermoanaerobaculia bacterium]
MIGPFCCEEGRSDGDFLGGTAAEVTRWLLLEYAGPWGRDAIADNDLPTSVRDWLAREVERVPGSRLLFIRRSPERAFSSSSESSEGPHQASAVTPHPSAGTPGVLFIVEPGDQSRVREIRVGSLEHLVAIDLEKSPPVASEQRFLLTCTNARRDRCCAKYGVPVYQKLSKLAPDWAWECTHTGGHRYAASVIALPEGAYYGFLDEASAPRLLEAHRRGQLLLNHYRGRSFHPRPVQAADVWLRREEDLLGWDDLRWVSSESLSTAPAVWRVAFEVLGRCRETLDVTESVTSRLTSCSPQKYKDGASFHVTRSPRGRADIL